MKRLLLGLSLIASGIASANAGGPDAYGYTWKDSNEPGGPAYNWYEISTIGTQVNGLGDDNFVGPIQLGFQFSYYWYTESKVWVGSNGYVEFGPGNLAAPFPTIPTAGGVENYIGGIVSDMSFLGQNNPGRCYVWSSPDTFCIEYKNLPYWSPSWPGYDQTSSNTFEIILNRLDSTITVNFNSFTGFSGSNYTSGIENGIGTMGLQPLNSQPPQQNYTIKYYYPPTSLSITDAGVDWNDNLDDGGIFRANNGQPLVLKTQVANHGNQSIPSFSVYEQVNTLTNTAVVSNSDTTFALVPSQNQMLIFSNPFAPTSTGTYRNVTQINGVVGDTIGVNDSIVQEIVVVDTTQNAIRLCYTNNQTNPVLGSISWNGGVGGVGVYIKPPTYPARIVNTNYVLTAAPASGLCFFAKVYDDDGPGGSPGTLLDSVAVSAFNVSIGGVTTVPLSSNVIITSGGFYVNWDMATANVSIGEDLTPPFSRRSYETFQNIWSTFRDYQTSDFFIGADYVTAFPENVGVSSIVTPANNSTVTNSSNVSCYIRNYGPASDNYYITVRYKLGGSPTIVSQPYTGALIPPGDSVLFNFTQQLIVPYTANDVLYVWTDKTADVNHNNDTSSVNISLVGVEELQPLEGVSVYPVPASSQVTFKFDDATPDAVVISITDLSGRVIDVQKFSAAIPGSSVSIDLSGYAPGTYLYTVQSGDKSGNGKIIRK